MSTSERSTGTASTSGRFEHLSEAECWELLEGKLVGRVAYTKANVPVVLPMNYTVRDRSIVMRTAAGSRLAEALREAPAAFEVDDIYDYLQAGWSVLVTGPAQLVNDTEELSDLWWVRHQAEPWVEGERNAFVRIQPSSVTGRRVHPR